MSNASVSQDNDAASSGARKRINLALQGGGSHGAFTWGVLDRLLEDERIEFEGISGTSAGGMNAVVLATGLALGGRQGARQRLEDFWTAIGDYGTLSPIQRSPWDRAHGRFQMESSLSYRMFSSFIHSISPYQWNPINYNPLREIASRHVDFQAVRGMSELKLFISATCVETGRVRIFKNAEITEDVLAASSALPFLFQAVKIDGRHFWDGGFCGNPALWPLIYECETADLAIVQIDPLERKKLPKSTLEIQERVAEISFNGTLFSELRAIQFVNRLIEKGALDPRYRKLNVHVIESEEAMTDLSPSTKLLVEPEFLRHLRHLGRKAAERWLEVHFADVGVRSSVDIKEKYLL